MRSRLFSRLLYWVSSLTKTVAERLDGKKPSRHAASYEMLLTAQKTARAIFWSLAISGGALAGLVLVLVIFPGNEILGEKVQPIVHGTLISVAASVFAGFIYMVADDQGNVSRIRKISLIADPRLLAAVFKDLDFYRNDYLENYEATIKFMKSPYWSNDLLLLEVTIKLTRPIHMPELTVTLVRDSEKTDSADDLEKLRGVADREIINQRFDERTIPGSIKSDEKFPRMYEMKWMSIDTKPQKYDAEMHQEQKRITWRTRRLSDELVSRTVQRRVAFCFTVPMEKESYYNLQLEHPTKGFDLTVDFTDLVDKLDVVLVDSLTSPLCVSSDRESKVGKGVIKLGHSEWMLPGSNVVLVWYKR